MVSILELQVEDDWQEIPASSVLPGLDPLLIAEATVLAGNANPCKLDVLLKDAVEWQRRSSRKRLGRTVDNFQSSFRYAWKAASFLHCNNS